MKVTYTVILALAVTVAIHAFPAKPEEETEEVELISGGGQQPIIDTGIIGGPGPIGGNPFYSSPFDSLFSSLAGMMVRMRQQMEQMFHRLPTNATEVSGEDPFGGFPGFSSGFPNFPQIGDLDLGKGNTTSVTKVIDGHKVVINETEIKQDNQFGGSFFKVRIIDVKPKDDSAEGTTERDSEAVTSKKDVESVEDEDTSANEIPKTQEKEAASPFDDIETFDEVDSVPTRGVFAPSSTSQWSSVEPLEPFEDNEIESVRPGADLSHDTFVNQLLADAGAPTNPDAELFDVESHVPFMTSRGRQPPVFEKIINIRR